jgi:hypothetical protein
VNNMSKAVSTISLAGVIAGILDISAAFIMFGLRGVPPAKILQGIASGLLGKQAFAGGTGTALLGAMLHFLIATLGGGFLFREPQGHGIDAASDYFRTHVRRSDIRIHEWYRSAAIERFSKTAILAGGTRDQCAGADVSGWLADLTGCATRGSGGGSI